jgi:hypothetical protein
VNLLLIIQIQQKNNSKISPNDELVDLSKYYVNFMNFFMKGMNFEIFV